MTKKIYLFEEGDPNDKRLLGGKGAGLAQMVQMGIPVPRGFTITTEECLRFFRNGQQWTPGLEEEIFHHLELLKTSAGACFGSETFPDLLSIRSGGFISQPGMMDTALNVGLNDYLVKVYAKVTGNEWLAYDCYRRLISMFCPIVFGTSKELLEHVMEAEKEKEHVLLDNQLSVKGLKNIIKGYKAVLKQEDTVFPQDVFEQVRMLVSAVFLSSMSDRAIVYRKIHDIVDTATAVTVQRMVFGNKNEISGTGVAFSRDPATGENTFYIEWLNKAQGEDVVAGIRTPQPGSKTATSNGLSMEEMLPEVYKQLLVYRDELELKYRDMVDIEFTIDNGELFILQVRPGKRTPAANIRIVMDFVKDGMLTEEEAILRVSESEINALLHSVLKIGDAKPIATGIGASPGADTGQVVLTSQKAVEWGSKGMEVIMARKETSPDDIAGMNASVAFITKLGGKTSHAALVARGMAKPAVVGMQDLDPDVEAGTLTINEHVINEGDWLSVDGTTGNVYIGKLERIKPTATPEMGAFLEMCKRHANMRVLANADTVEDATVAKKFGANGIGLTRIEHMFFGADRLPIMQEMILNIDNAEKRSQYLALLEPFLLSDIKGLFTVFAGEQVTIRLMDPPLHEFLHTDEQLAKLDLDPKVIAGMKKKRASLHEHNPMMGKRGCRLAILYPDTCEMQVKAIIGAACEVENAVVKIMVPFIIDAKEFNIIKEVIVATAEQVMAEKGITVNYLVGSMLETPRATLTAGKLAHTSQFSSVGSNDLTQASCLLSRDDCASFIPAYMEKGIMKNDFFEVIDEDGPGALIKIAEEQIHAYDPDHSIGVCGEHAGEPKSISFFNSLRGINTISCSPYRVPIAILAAAHAEIKWHKEHKASKVSYGVLEEAEA